eukprot:gene30328-53814_t
MDDIDANGGKVRSRANTGASKKSGASGEGADKGSQGSGKDGSAGTKGSGARLGKPDKPAAAADGAPAPATPPSSGEPRKVADFTKGMDVVHLYRGAGKVEEVSEKDGDPQPRHTYKEESLQKGDLQPKKD